MPVDPELLDGGTEFTESVEKAKVLDFTWLLARLLQQQNHHLGAAEQLVPAWSGFNAQLRQEQVRLVCMYVTETWAFRLWLQLGYQWPC